jgi:hypothetical protein
MIAIMGTRLNAQVIIKDLQVQNMPEKSLPPTVTGARRRMELPQWSMRTGPGACRQGKGPHIRCTRTRMDPKAAYY